MKQKTISFLLILVMVFSLLPSSAFAAETLAITTNPVSQTVVSGEKTEFSVEAEGPSELRYQWSVDRGDGNGFSEMAGETGNVLTLDAVEAAWDGYRYQCTVYCGVSDNLTSKTAVLKTRIRVQFDLNGKSGAVSDQVIDYGSPVTRPADPSGSGATFLGWFSDEACENAWNFEEGIPKDNLTLYAGWNCDHPRTQTLNAVAATCQSEGYSGDVYCAECGELISEGTVIALAEHTIPDSIEDYVWGYDETSHWICCSVCGEKTDQGLLLGTHIYLWGECLFCGAPNPALTEDYTGLLKENDLLFFEAYYYFTNGEYDETYTGMAPFEDSWYYVSEGTVDTTFSGLVMDENYGLFQVTNGVIDTTVTGEVEYEGKTYYLEGGKNENPEEIADPKNGLVYDETAGFVYYTDGEVDTAFNGLVKYDQNWYYVAEGTVESEYTGLYKDAALGWYYVENGQVNFEFDGLVRAYGAWFLVQNGTIQWSYTGLYKDASYGWFYLENGQINWEFDGLVRAYGAWFLVQNGTIQWSYTGLYKDQNLGWFYLQGGQIIWGVYDVIAYGDGLYLVQNSSINWDYTGSITIGEKTYQVVNGYAGRA